MLCIVKEAPSFLQNQLQLHQLTVAALQAFAVAIDLKKLTLQLIQLSLLQTTACFEYMPTMQYLQQGVKTFPSPYIVL